ncbi:MAG: hypothetical protein ACXQTL_04825 [Methanosarcinales archaeon]
MSGMAEGIVLERAAGEKASQQKREWRVLIEQMDSHVHFKIFRDGYECHPGPLADCIMRLPDFYDFVTRLSAVPVRNEKTRWIHPYGDGADELASWLRRYGIEIDEW